MPTELLWLALAAAMPLAAFALYAGIRAVGEARDRRPSRDRWAGRPRSSDAAHGELARPAPFPSDSPGPADPGRPTLPALLDPAKPATPRPVAQPVSLDRAQTARSGQRERSTDSRPVARPEPARGVLAKLPVVRPTATGSATDAAPIRPLAAATHASSAIGDSPSPAVDPGRVEPEAIPTRVVPPAPARSGGRDGRAAAGPVSPPPAVPATVPDRPASRGPGLLSSSLEPIRSAFGRGNRARAQPAPIWPQPEGLAEPFRPIVAAADGSGPCPFCEDSRERGAWFCRRCRRPLDSRASAATAAVKLPARPLPSAAAPPDPSWVPMPAGRPTQREARPLITRLPVVHPTQYVPATRPAATLDRAERSVTNAPPAGAVATTDAERLATADRPPAATVASPALAQSTADAPGPTVIRPAPIVARAPQSSGPVGESRLVAVGPGRPGEAARGNGHRPAARRAGGAATAGAGEGIVAAARANPGNGARPGMPTETTRSPVGAPPRVDLNRATAGELSTLRGVGRVTAQRIVAARDDDAFTAVDALLDRKIVGRTVLERIRDQVTV